MEAPLRTAAACAFAMKERAHLVGERNIQPVETVGYVACARPGTG